MLPPVTVIQVLQVKLHSGRTCLNIGLGVLLYKVFDTGMLYVLFSTESNIRHLSSQGQKEPLSLPVSEYPSYCLY
jgi:hypothetical protein